VRKHPLTSHVPKRRRRVDHVFQHPPIYFVTACTHQRRHILNSHDNHARLGEYGRRGADHGAWSEESYGEKWGYVGENPVRAGLVEQWNDWPFAGKVVDLEFRDDPN
jgi:REP element-mobilizing transposase RayT